MDYPLIDSSNLQQFGREEIVPIKRNVSSLSSSVGDLDERVTELEEGGVSGENAFFIDNESYININYDNIKVVS